MNQESKNNWIAASGVGGCIVFFSLLLWLGGRQPLPPKPEPLPPSDEQRVITDPTATRPIVIASAKRIVAGAWEVDAVVGRMVMVHAKSLKDAKVRWGFCPERDSLWQAHVEGGKVAFVAQAVGNYYMCADVDGLNMLSPVWVRVVVTKSDVGPDPIPDPKPDPKPDPDPKPQPAKVAAYLVIIEESKDATARRGALFADATVAGLLKSYKRFTVVDKDVKNAAGEVPPDLKTYLAKAAEKQLPYCFAVDDAGWAVYEGAMPATKQEVIDLLKKTLGK